VAELRAERTGDFEQVTGAGPHGQQTGSKRPKLASLNYSESNQEKLPVVVYVVSVTGSRLRARK
jgi:hypothetical protein